jgi:hypothetical protein
MPRAALALVVLAGLARAAVAAEPVPEKTDVYGVPPEELVGRWLVVGLAHLPTGKVHAVTRTWDIRRGAEHLELRLAGAIPKPIADRIAAAAATGALWRPDDADLAAVAAAWQPGPPPGDYTGIEHRIAVAGSIPADVAADDVVKGADLVLASVETFTGKERVASTTSVYGVRERDAASLGGAFVSTSVAISFFAIPITLKGDFRGYRVDAAPAPWWKRLLAGCGRR